MDDTRREAEDSPAVVRRRTDAVLSPSALLQQVLHAPMQPPWKRVRLEPDSFADHRQRPVSAGVSVAELYHHNSKLFPAMLPGLTALSTDVAEFRRTVVHERATGRTPTTVHEGLDEHWHALLRTMPAAVGVDAFYAVELRVAAGDLLTVFEPVSGDLRPVKRLTPADRVALHRAVRLMTPAVPVHGGPLLAALGLFSWNDILLGPRGYRRTVLETGRVAQEILRRADDAGLAVTPRYEFTDRDVDTVLEADGVEEGTLMVFELGGGGDVG